MHVVVVDREAGADCMCSSSIISNFLLKPDILDVGPFKEIFSNTKTYILSFTKSLNTLFLHI